MRHTAHRGIPKPLSRRTLVWAVATPLGVAAAVLSGIYFQGTGTPMLGAATSGIGVGIIVWLVVALATLGVVAVATRAGKGSSPPNEKGS